MVPMTAHHILTIILMLLMISMLDMILQNWNFLNPTVTAAEMEQRVKDAGLCLELQVGIKGSNY